jgi:hypothetical protein
MHVARADWSHENVAAATSHGEDRKEMPPLLCAADRAESLFDLGGLRIRPDARLVQERAFDFGNRYAMLLAFRGVAGVSIETVKFHRVSSARLVLHLHIHLQHESSKDSGSLETKAALRARAGAAICGRAPRRRPDSSGKAR